MDFNLKKYRVLKVKKELKKSELILFFNSAKIKSNKWIAIEKQLKKLKLKYHQIFNNTTLKTVENSIFTNINKIISGIVILVKPVHKSTIIELKSLKKDLGPLFVLLFVKLNNKLYNTAQLKNLNSFTYKKTVFNFHSNLEKCLKTSYRLTNNK